MSGTRLRLLVTLVALLGLPLAVRAGLAQAPPALEVGIQLFKEGDFEAAVQTLDDGVKQLEQAGPAHAADLARAHLYLGAAYVGLEQETPAREHFRAALAVDPRLAPSAAEFSPRVIRVFEAARQNKKGSALKKTGIGVGAAAAIGVGVVALAGGGVTAATVVGLEPSPSPVPSPSPLRTAGVAPPRVNVAREGCRLHVFVLSDEAADGVRLTVLRDGAPAGEFLATAAGVDRAAGTFLAGDGVYRLLGTSAAGRQAVSPAVEVSGCGR